MGGEREREKRRERRRVTRYKLGEFFPLRKMPYKEMILKLGM